MVDAWRVPCMYTLPCAELLLKGKRFSYQPLRQLPASTESYIMLPNISQAPALYSPLFTGIVREAPCAVMLNDSMNRPKPFSAPCLAVSCFQTGPNPSLARFGAPGTAHEGGILRRLSLQKQECYLSHCCSSPVSSDYLSVCLSGSLTDCSE